MTRYSLCLADPADDAQLRARMAHDWIEGDAAITLRREPSYFDASRLLGPAVQVIVAREASTDRIVATGCRSVATSYIDREPRRTAFLSDLRIDPAHRNGFLLARIYRFLRTLHDADPLPSYTLVYDDNERALTTLVGGRAGLPHYLPRGRMIARAVRLTRKRRMPRLAGIDIGRATRDALPDIVEFLNAQRASHRWAPALDIADFEHGRRCDTLRAEDFFVARRDGRICATMAAWDQGALRQAHVERYARAMQWLRTPYNLMATVRGWPKLPEHGKPLPYVYLAFIAVQDDDAALCAALLSRVYNSLCGERYLYALAALHDDDPLLPVFDDYPGTTSAVRLFEVDFSSEPEGDPTRASTFSAGRACVEFALT
ncbi:hypothetical protein C0Z18_05795 [Trinickia dabaoshanensis]|uniref:GNAT family N-acetyltransferase n=2 Tax=Trinickia dabaoshanensis TaxID=564714 RepID=A0A2N7VY17_9BURK|nr:hypothetical protein C0Z18_05795 [Trinickia dabaoshanensis]